MCAVYICYADDSLEKFGALPQGYLEAQRWKKKEEGGGGRGGGMSAKDPQVPSVFGLE